MKLEDCNHVVVAIVAKGEQHVPGDYWKFMLAFRFLPTESEGCLAHSYIALFIFTNVNHYSNVNSK